MKKAFLSIMALLLSIVFTSSYIRAENTTEFENKEESSESVETDLAPNAKSSYLIEFTSGKVISSKNEDEKLYPASMTKMMGLLLIYEALNNKKITWDDSVTTSEHAASMGGSQVFLEPNEVMSVKDLIKAICIASANDAMVAMAEKIAGTHEGFVKQMNQKAKELGLKNTNFVNATGLHDPQHYSSAKDMALIAQALIQEGGDALLEITGTYDAYIREDGDNKFWLVNTNKLLKQYEGVDGLKTGFTQEAMSCITVTAKKNNLRLIAVVMGEPSSNVRNQEIKQLLDYGYAQYAQELLYPAGSVIEETIIDNGKLKKVNLVTLEDMVYVYEKGNQSTEAEKNIEITKEDLPYVPNEAIGKVQIKMSDGFVMEASIGVEHEVQPLEYLDFFMKSFAAFLA
ncbi:MAG: D-alanyl-D-alanine carboxypeptidase [Erysipelotrichaceae bacterium]|nr:D-alanyl-D-alanine carboxypeptidase [Erysipelotrichaceae bacterium]